MTARGALLATMTVLVAVLVGLVAAIAVRRLVRLVGDRRRWAAERVMRPRVAAVLADVPDRDEPPSRRLRRAPRPAPRHALRNASRHAAGGLRAAIPPVTLPSTPLATLPATQLATRPTEAAGPEAAGTAAAEAVRRLVALWAARGRRERRVLEAVVFGYLGKVRGPGRRALVEFLHRIGAVDRARRRVHRPGVVGRARAAEVLGRVGGAEAELVRLLADRQAVVRVVAVAGLRFGRPLPGVVPALLAAVDGPRRIPPTLVTEALLGLGPEASPALAAALAGAADAPSTAGPAVAAEALGLLGTASAGAALVAAAGDRSTDAELRIRAARALGRIGPPAALEPLIGCLADGEPPVLRAVAAKALGDLGSPRAVPHLVPLLHGPHRLAANAASALARLGPHGARALATAAEGEDPAARYATAALATLELSRRAVAAPGVPTSAG